MKDRKRFFAAAIVSESFRNGLINQDTRLETAQKGYLGNTFGLEKIDETIFKEIGPVESLGEFTTKYTDLRDGKYKEVKG